MLSPFQAMVLEVYRTHTRLGFPGSQPGSVKHDIATCRKCRLLHEDHDAFEGVLPWADVRHLLPVGRSPVVETRAVPTTFRDDHERDMADPEYREAYLAEERKLGGGAE